MPCWSRPGGYAAPQPSCWGHHRGDVAEDQMLRFLRGTGWPALGGMRAEDAERHLLRPPAVYGKPCLERPAASLRHHLAGGCQQCGHSLYPQSPEAYPFSRSCTRKIPVLRKPVCISGSWPALTAITGGRKWSAILPAAPGRNPRQRHPAPCPAAGNACGPAAASLPQGCGQAGPHLRRPGPFSHPAGPWIRLGRKAGAAPPFSCPAISWPVSSGGSIRFLCRKTAGKAEKLRSGKGQPCGTALPRAPTQRSRLPPALLPRPLEGLLLSLCRNVIPLCFPRIQRTLPPPSSAACKKAHPPQVRPFRLRRPGKRLSPSGPVPERHG